MSANAKRRRGFCIELLFDRNRRLPGRNARTVTNAENMCVDGESLCPEGAVHDDISRLAANAWKLFKRVSIRGDFAAVIFDKHFRQGDDVLCLGIEQSDRLDVVLQSFFAQFEHLGWCSDFVEQQPCGLVDADIG